MITRGGRVDDRMSAPGGRPGQEFTARETESVAHFFLVDNSQIEGWNLVKYYVLRVGCSA